mmetsp:Transcript_17788/g.28794  ORF Transcript_17788/g.28794 Transcript_17788/m.28794 type:complete len:221 (-) Transcript_17788:52-714(-)
MHRFLGKKKEAAPAAPAPTLDETGKRIEERGDSLQAKIDKIDKELLVYQKQLKVAKGPKQQQLKKRALDLLKRKKMYQKQQDQLTTQGFNIDQQAFMIESMKDTAATVDCMKASAVTMKQQFKELDIDQVEDLQDDIHDLMYEHEEVQEVMGRALGMDYDNIDEDELDSELAALDDLDLNDLEDESDYLKTQKLPDAPTSEVSATADKDEYGLPAVPLPQ